MITLGSAGQDSWKHLGGFSMLIDMCVAVHCVQPRLFKQTTSHLDSLTSI